MNEIIDVDFKEVVDLEKKTTEELKIETNNLYNQMEAIGNVGIMLAAQAGQRLITIKERLQHGKFETWCKDNLEFSKSKAEKMMKLATKLEDSNSIFSKTESITDIGITKVLALLSAPEDVAEEVINNPDAAEMSVKEFKEEIARLKKENEDELAKVRNENCRLNMENQKVKDLNKEIERLKEEIEEASDTIQGEKEVAEKAKEILSLREKLKKEKENLKNKVQAEKDKLLAEQKEAIEEAIKKAEEEAGKKLLHESESIRKRNEEATAEIEKLKRKIENTSNADIAIFKVKADQLQQDFNSCLATIDTVRTKGKDQAEKMRGALLQIIKIMEGQLE